ncbi:Rossmann fold nucleotide-binding protein [Nocardioides sp. AE5]|uniref:LOG family protein n=1 Tax=Nocardioides sp. AE5 TaxID=2962573 RepID=UPI0028829552|nr:Rossmann fold nucleotide-binding protein [Nocardioides sp. AE5]MDT0201116.1 LOG family protein [Nocardioides sp. AE5]
MRRSSGPVIEVESLADFDRRIMRARSLAGWHLQSVDVSQRSAELAQVPVAGALFLGCTFAEGDEESVRARGGIVFPTIPDVPLDTYRGRLYTAGDLYDTAAYPDSLDARVYGWSQQPENTDTTLARALHDHAMDDALGEWVQGRSLVGVMGGHALARNTPAYAGAARLGQLLGARHTVATGGGPGAMEAANLGAWLAGTPEADLDAALALLGRVPDFRPDVGAWVGAAFAVRERWPAGGESLGIPTWHYGHEPPNAFPTAIAKYFRNATREAILLEICRSGIVFLPGAAGTVQEIFQDACENYYADADSVAPMVLVGVDHWTRELPAWPLLQALAAEREMGEHVHLVDSLDEAAAIIG